VIVVQPASLGEPAGRLLGALVAHGHTVFARPEMLPAGAEPVTLAVADGPFVFDFVGAVRAIGARQFRVLLLSRLGAHPDARAVSLQRLWRLEEHVRAGGVPTLTLRFAPLVGPRTPLWRKLRSRPALPKGGRKLVNPVAETDAVETLLRALDGRAPWRGWYEVAGPDAVTLAELRDLAAAMPAVATPPAAPAEGAGAWEPPLEEIAEHRLAECEPWASAFGITPTPLAAWTGAAVR
jgi:uncharacterized protein YbjT (DUF2867 family)